MKTLRIKVTLGHIALGNPGKAFSCPIANAMKDMGLSKTVSAGPAMLAWIRPDNGLAYVTLPPEAVRFMRAFDRRDPVSPFEFEIEVPEDSIPNTANQNKKQSK